MVSDLQHTNNLSFEYLSSSIKSRTLSANPALSPYISHFIIGSATLETPDMPEITLLPNNSLEIVLLLNNSFIATRNSTSEEHIANFITGMFNSDESPVIKPLKMNGSFQWVTICMTPAGLTKLFGIQAGEITNTILDMDQCFPEFTSMLLLFLNSGYIEFGIKKFLDEFLLNRIHRNRFKTDTRLIDLFDCMKNINRKCCIKELAENLCISYRTLERLFSEKVGLNIKEYSRIQCIKKVFQCLHNTQCFKYPDLIESGHYYDQSHLIREFKKVTGLTPKQFSEITGGKFYLERPFLINQ